VLEQNQHALDLTGAAGSLRESVERRKGRALPEGLGEAALRDERYDDAASCFASAAQTKPKFSTAYIFQAIALGLGGRAEEARSRKSSLTAHAFWVCRYSGDYGYSPAKPLNRSAVATEARITELSAKEPLWIEPV
jgi:hypothetical protein